MFIKSIFGSLKYLHYSDIISSTKIRGGSMVKLTSDNRRRTAVCCRKEDGVRVQPRIRAMTHIHLTERGNLQQEAI